MLLLEYLRWFVFVETDGGNVVAFPFEAVLTEERRLES